MSEVKDFWETCVEGFAHLNGTHAIHSEGKRSFLTRLIEEVLSIDFYSKTVLDYGIGRGDLGKFLYENLDIYKYIAMDVAQRSLDASKDFLEKYEQTEFLLADLDFKSLQWSHNIDIFTSFACIQHFPNIDYLDTFLENLNRSSIKDLILQIRDSDRGYFFEDGKPYDSTGHVARRCCVSKEYVSTKLYNYRMLYFSTVQKSGYQYLHFRGK